MWSNLLIFHSEEKNRAELNLPGFLIWQTCMRTLYIGDSRLISEDAVYPRLGYQVHTGYEAYSLLLEIASGIRSRLLGETEVMAQFKETFKNESLPSTALGEYARTLRDQIIEDARKIRSSHLRNLGDQSYGGIAKKLLKNRSVTVVGSGQLAEKVIPYLTEKGRTVYIFARNNERIQYLMNRFPSAKKYEGDELPETEAYVLCAPVPFEDMIQGKTEPLQIIDFREKNFGELYSGENIEYHSFENILNSLRETENRLKILRKDLQIIVSKIAQEREFGINLNSVYCWEDIPCIAQSELHPEKVRLPGYSLT